MIDAAGVQPVGSATGDVELVRRRLADSSWLFALNHGTEAATVTTAGHDLVNDEPVDGSLRLEPQGVGYRA